MKTVLDDELAYLIYATIEEIPYGCVATYGKLNWKAKKFKINW